MGAVPLGVGPIPASWGAEIAAGRDAKWTLAVQTDGLAREILQRMFFAARNTSKNSKQLIVFDGAAAEGVFDAKPIDLWDAWRFAKTEATLKLRIWSTAPNEDKTQAHAAYLAALDREEQAARLLADRLGLPTR